MAYNKLRKWHGTLSTDLPKLQFLNIMGNSKFKIKANKDQLLRGTALKTILGARTTSKGCVRCNFSRTDVPLKELMGELKGCEYVPPYNMPLIYQFQKRFIYFNGTCARKSCEIAFVQMKKVKKTYRNYCMDKGRSLRPIEYILGIVAMVFNSVVIVTILCNRCLIKKTSMFLTAQLAFGDLLLAVFSLAIANGHEIISYSGLRQWRKDQCPYFRTLLILGQSIEAFTSAFMTLERYLAIVHCMRPNLRITPRSACFICAFILIVSGLFCFVIEHFDHPIVRENYMCVLIQDFRTTKRILASQILMLLFVAIYLAVLGMYIHIFICVRKSGQSAGIQRESALAKRISIIVFSNMLFYAVPNLSIVVFSAGGVKVLSDRAVNFIIRIWLPPMCMIANACLNPFLFAFRNEQFLTSLRQVARIIISGVCQVKKLPFGLKRFNKGRSVYKVGGVEQGQNSSQLTLNTVY